MTTFNMIEVFEVEFDGVQAKHPILRHLTNKKNTEKALEEFRGYAKAHAVSFDIKVVVCLNGKRVNIYAPALHWLRSRFVV